VTLALIQNATGNYLPLLHSTIPWHAAYCERHNIVYLPSFGNLCPKQHPIWSRYPLLISALQSGLFDIVIWMDADAVIADPSTSLADASHEFQNIGMACHPSPAFKFNAGVMFVRCGRPSLHFLQSVWNRGHIDNPQGWEDQPSIGDTARKTGFVLDKVADKWNSTPWMNNVPHPVVRSYHGHPLDNAGKIRRIAQENLFAFQGRK
jgi:hypothetical protein